MKLFHQLLVAPAALGLLAPLAVNANEANFNDVSNYSDEEAFIEINTNSFNNTPKSLLAGGEGLVNDQDIDHNHNDGFSNTTVASQEVSMLLFANDGDASQADEETAQFHYHYEMNLDTTFNGEDNLNVVIETGNTSLASNLPNILDFGAQNSDDLKIGEISYTRSIGDLSVSIGDQLDVTSQFVGACAYSGFTDHLSNCGTGLSAGLEGDVSISTSFDIGNGFVGGIGFTGVEGATQHGLFTEESIDAYAAQIAYAADNYGIAVSYSNIDSPTDGTALIGVSEDNTVWGLNGYYTFDGPIDSISVGYETANPKTGSDTTNWFAGITTGEIGPGSFSAGVGTSGHTTDSAEDTLLYEATYNWDVNDSTSMTVGGYLLERTDASGADENTGIAWSTTFSF